MLVCLSDKGYFYGRGPGRFVMGVMATYELREGDLVIHDPETEREVLFGFSERFGDWRRQVSIYTICIGLGADGQVCIRCLEARAQPPQLVVLEGFVLTTDHLAEDVLAMIGRMQPQLPLIGPRVASPFSSRYARRIT